MDTKNVQSANCHFHMVSRCYKLPNWLPAPPMEIGFKQIWCQESLNQFERIFSVLERNVLPQRATFGMNLDSVLPQILRSMWQLGGPITRCRWCTIGLQQLLHGDTLERRTGNCTKSKITATGLHLVYPTGSLHISFRSVTLISPCILCQIQTASFG